MSKEEDWDLIIRSKRSLFDLDVKEIFRYRDLLVLLVKRDFVSVYKQTVLGPLWFVLQPLITAVVFSVVFGRFAGVKTGGIPPVLFYLSGLTLWTYFSECLIKTSTTFISNAGVFGKVYFPRLIIPLSIVVSNLFKLLIQFVLFLSVWFFYIGTLTPRYELMVLLPFLVIIIAGLGFGFGILISSLTTKYRDLNFLVGFGVQLLMYATIIFPVSNVSADKQWILFMNPVSPVVEAFKHIFLGSGVLNWYALSYSAGFMVLIVFIAVLVFNRVEQSFMDTV